MKTKTEPKLSAVITVTIDYRTYLLPEGKNLNQVLELLSGMRMVSEDSFHYLEPNRRVLLDKGEAEISVAVSRRELVDADELAKIKAEDEAARVEREEKRREEAKRAEGK